MLACFRKLGLTIGLKVPYLNYMRVNVWDNLSIGAHLAK